MRHQGTRPILGSALGKLVLGAAAVGEAGRRAGAGRAGGCPVGARSEPPEAPRGGGTSSGLRAAWGGGGGSAKNMNQRRRRRRRLWKERGGPAAAPGTPRC